MLHYSLFVFQNRIPCLFTGCLILMSFDVTIFPLPTDSHTTRSNTVSSVAGGAGPVGGNMTMLTSTAADIDVLDDKISQCEQKISQVSSLQNLLK